MRIVVYPHMLEIGGSQLNAIELAAAVRDLGQDVLVFGQPGPLIDRIADLQLEFVPAPQPRGRPSRRVMHALTQLVRERTIDVVHGYEWTTALEAYWGPRARLGVPAVGTVMSMAVAPFLPTDLPLIVGTEQIAAYERAAGRDAVEVIEPPVDVRGNAPGAVAADEFRRTHGLDEHAHTVVCVTRLAAELKLEGVLAAIEATAAVAATTPVQLVLVGDGTARPVVATHAERVNADAGRAIVIITGELTDPRPAYAAADVALGMGGSALRAMAFGVPLVVQGENGFWEPLTPETVDRFLWTGWYGSGEGAELGPARLASILRDLLADPARRAALGRYGRELVEGRFSLRAAGKRQLEIYQRAIADAPIDRRRSVGAGGASVSRLAVYKIRRRTLRVLGRADVEDFNIRPVARRGRVPRSGETRPDVAPL